MAVIGLLQLTLRHVADEEAKNSKSRSVTAWGRFLKDVLNQRTVDGKTALMLACANG